jgi:hypothetical protein
MNERSFERAGMEEHKLHEEIRAAYAAVGIDVAERATYGVYSHLRCGGCGAIVGTIGDRLLPGMAARLVGDNLELYAKGILGCDCGHQADSARKRIEARKA